MLVSVIIPFYNRSDILELAVDSVLNQIYTNFELILVDDGSNDGFDSEKYIEKDSRIRIIRNENNNGACHARNEGIKSAKGDVIAFLDSDNIWEKTYLNERLIGINQGYDFVFGKYLLEKMDGTKVEWPEIEIDAINIKSYIIGKLCIENVIDTNTIVLKKECFNYIGMFDEKMERFQDWDLFSRLFFEYDFKYLFQNNCLVKGIERKDSISKKVSFWDARIRILDKHWNTINKYNKVIDVVNYFRIISKSIPWTEEQKKNIFSRLTAEDICSILDENRPMREEIIALKRINSILCKEKKWTLPSMLLENYSRIVLYGYGDMGHDYAEAIEKSSQFSLVGIVDKTCIKDNRSVIQVSLDFLKNRDAYDCVLISVINKEVYLEIVQNLIDYGVSKDIIIWNDLSF